MAVRRLIATLLLLPALASCSDDEPGSSGSGDPTSPATSEPTPTGTPPPTEPPEASEHTAAGAKAFVEYWVTLYSAAVASGDTEALIEISTPACRACRRITSLIESIYTEGGSVESDGWEVVRHDSATLTSANTATVHTVLTLHPERIQRPDEPVERHPGAPRAEMTFDLDWESSRWTMHEIYQGLQ